MKYHRINPDWKYELDEIEIYTIPPLLRLDLSAPKLTTPYFTLYHDIVVVRKGYRWDGASGPALDTSTFMRASLIHDVLTQAIDEEIIHPGNQTKADKIMRAIAIEDGMPRPRAWWAYLGVRSYMKLKHRTYTRPAPGSPVPLNAEAPREGTTET